MGQAVCMEWCACRAYSAWFWSGCTNSTSKASKDYPGHPEPVQDTVPSLSCSYSNVCFLSFFQLPGVSSFLYLSASGVARSSQHGLLIRGNRAVPSLDPPFVGEWWVEDEQRPWGLPQFWEWWLLTPRISHAGSRQVAVTGGHFSGADSFLPRVWLEPVCCCIPTPWMHCLSKTT